jgi:hypothetical protein
MSGISRHEFVLSAIADTEGTIRATDTKASIALVLHGLLLTTLVTVTRELGHAVDGRCTLESVFVGIAIVIGLCALASVMQLLRCIAPAPASAIPALPGRPTGSFFVPIGMHPGPRAKLEQIEAEAIIEALESKDSVTLGVELAAELVKTSAIRQRKLHLIRWGLGLLAFELGATAIYVGGVGLLTL